MEVIQCDFDGTVTRNNLSILLRENFAPGEWRRIDADYLLGRITVEQSNKLQYALIKEPKEILQEFVRQNIDIRPGFVEFVSYCRENAVKLVIVSSGLDFYIETALAQIGIPDLELHCGRTDFTDDGIIVSYTDPEGNAIDGGFKGKYLKWLRGRNIKLIYVGDGLSDLEPACLADLVFATGHLATMLRFESVAWGRFIDFYDLLRLLQANHHLDGSHATTP